ncbi:MAG: ATP-binding cassette domain-containing protein, partial [Proteobacteria bacterium]|nr:ATP-binding cassette domain-containing protein [Pseudomonadota bacterium]
QLRDYIGGFGFHGDKALSPCAPFSGGEKARLVLAMLVYKNPNLLLLDEPTNHLDLEMRHALSVALQDYQGAIILVSHDRHLLRTVTDQFLLVGEGKVQSFDGDLDDYRLWLAERKKAEYNSADDITNPVVSRKDQRKQDAEFRQKKKPLLDALKKAEQAVEKYHNEQRRLEAELADPEIYTDSEKDKLKKLLTRKVEVDKALDVAETDWMEAEERLEEAKVEM